MSERWAAKAFMFGLAALAGCARSGPPAPPREEPAATRVHVAEVSGADAAGEVSVPGVVAARERATLASRVAAAVVELPFQAGERVPAGAVLVRLDDRAFRSSLAAAEAACELAEADRRRADSLWAKGSGTRRDAEEAGARAVAACAAVSRARDELAYVVLKAPYKGTIAARHVHVGDVVSPGAPLLEIEAEGAFEIRATIDAQTAARVHVGDRLPSTIDGAGPRVDATVRALSPAGDPATHRFEVQADLPRAAGLRSGVFARLWLPTPGGEKKLLVAASAVFRRGGLWGVFVIADGRARLRWVAVGETQRGLTEVRAGVEAGERVALDPAGLRDGVRVQEAS
jgi:RND family efflux transporter MFP subunit